MSEGTEVYDLAIVGGGVNGCGIARDAAGRGAKVILLDNLFVSGSSTPIAETDAEGNTYQLRKLQDGSSHRVLKNFPSEVELQAALMGIGAAGKYQVWQHYWAFEYTAAAR